MAPQYHIGTSGFSYPHWRSTFYPEKLPQSRWLEHYGQEFSTVELNSSFYGLPSEEAFRSWRTRTAKGFIFALKASRLITHMHRLDDVGEPLQTFLSRVGILEEKLGLSFTSSRPAWSQTKGCWTPSCRCCRQRGDMCWSSAIRPGTGRASLS